MARRIPRFDSEILQPQDLQAATRFLQTTKDALADIRCLEDQGFSWKLRASMTKCQGMQGINGSQITAVEALSMIDVLLAAGWPEGSLEGRVKAKGITFVQAVAEGGDAKVLLPGLIKAFGLGALPAGLLTNRYAQWGSMWFSTMERPMRYETFEAFCDNGVSALDTFINPGYTSHTRKENAVESAVASNAVRWLREHGDLGVKGGDSIVGVSVEGAFRYPGPLKEARIPVPYFDYLIDRLEADGRDIDDPAFTVFPLIYHAIEQGEVEIARGLLEKGADPTWWSQWHGNRYLTQNLGVSIEILNAAYGKSAMKKLLVEYGMADVSPSIESLLFSQFDVDVTRVLRSEGLDLKYAKGDVFVYKHHDCGGAMGQLSYSCVVASESQEVAICNALVQVFASDPKYVKKLEDEKFLTGQKLFRFDCPTSRGARVINDAMQVVSELAERKSALEKPKQKSLGMGM